MIISAYFIGLTSAFHLIFRFADVFSRHMKMFLLLLYISGTGFFVWFTLLINGTIPESTCKSNISYSNGSIVLE